MASINIQLPVMDVEQSIEIEVRVNGEKKIYHYRVEIFKWEGCEQKMSHAECLKNMIMIGGSYKSVDRPTKVYR